MCEEFEGVIAVCLGDDGPYGCVSFVIGNRRIGEPHHYHLSRSLYVGRRPLLLHHDEVLQERIYQEVHGERVSKIRDVVYLNRAAVEEASERG